MTLVLGVLTGLLAVGAALLAWQLARARSEAADLRWRLEQAQRQLADERRKTLPASILPASDIERLSAAGEQRDPLAVPRAVWHIGRREAHGAIRVLGRTARWARRTAVAPQDSTADHT